MKNKSHQIKTGASMNRHNSKQDYRTPKELLVAVQSRFGIISFDLAADRFNHVAKRFFSERQNALKQDWMQLEGNLWLNPPFGDIEPWAKKCICSATRHSVIFLLTPASVGSNWFCEYVHNRAHSVLFLSPRLSFDGKSPYPKDCMISIFQIGITQVDRTIYQCWRWK